MAILSILLNHRERPDLAAIIDAEDAERVSRLAPWYAMKTPEGRWYAQAFTYDGGKQRSILLHRLIADAPARVLVDHIDGDGLNCTRANLRLCTSAQNNANSRLARNNTSGYKGVYFNKDKRLWQAQISVKNQTRNLGRYKTKEEAALAYDEAARELYGSFARLNFPREGERAAFDKL